MQSEVKKILEEKIASLLLDEGLEEIMVIGDGSPVYVYDKKKGTVAIDMVLEESVNDSNPLLNARLPDGSRVNATLSTVTPRGSTITIRKFKREPLTIADLIRHKTMSPKLAAFLWVAVEGLRTKPANILILGGAATGKTTTLNALSYFIPANERIISIENTMEVSLKHEHWIPMETRPPSTGTKNEVTMDALLKNALRMRPDRIIVGEVRGEEALTLFAAMNTGHDGCTATIHANSAREGLARLQNHPMNVPDVMIPVLDIIIAQKKQMEKGKLIRRVFEVAEISGREGGNILTNIIQELAKLTNLTVREIDEEIERREAILDTLAKSNLKQDELH